MNASIFQRSGTNLHHLRILAQAFGSWKPPKYARMLWGGGESQPLKIISIMVKPRMCWCSKMHYHWSVFAPSSDSPSLWFRIQFLIQVVKTDPISYIPYVCSLSESYVLRALICRIVPWVRFKWAQKFSSGNYPFFSSELRIRGFQLIRQSVDFLP